MQLSQYIAREEAKEGAAEEAGEGAAAAVATLPVEQEHVRFRGGRGAGGEFEDWYSFIYHSAISMQKVVGWSRFQ